MILQVKTSAGSIQKCCLPDCLICFLLQFGSPGRIDSALSRLSILISLIHQENALIDLSISQSDGGSFSPEVYCSEMIQTCYQVLLGKKKLYQHTELQVETVFLICVLETKFCFFDEISHVLNHCLNISQAN